MLMGLSTGTTTIFPTFRLNSSRNEIMVRNDAFLVETTLMARIDFY
jgi:hypothetical protein